MNEPTRYTACGDEVAMADPAGPLVKWEDYQRLDALCKQLMAQHSDISCENIMLRKAGDGLYKSMLEIGCNEMADNFQYDDWWGSMRAWNAAKEGKQP